MNKLKIKKPCLHVLSEHVKMGAYVADYFTL